MSSGIYDSVNDILVPTSGYEASKTIDATPTQNSANAVQSGGVYTAFAEVNDALRTVYSASCATDTAVSAKVATNSYYELKDGQLVVVSFRFDVGANPTLNINNTGAKNIRYSMTTSGFPAGVIKSGDYALFRYYEKEDYYILVSVSGIANLASEIDSVNQTLTNGLDNEAATRATLGAHNIAKPYPGYAIGTVSGDTVTLETIANCLTVIAKMENGKKYIASKASGVGNRFRLAVFNDLSSTGTNIINDPTKTSYEYTNSSNYKYLVFSVSVQESLAVDSIAPMIRLASDSDSTYTPYVMTNTELTESLIKDWSATTYDNLSSYNSSNNKYTCPCDGYVYVTLPIGTSGISVELYDTYYEVTAMQNSNKATKHGWFVKKGCVVWYSNPDNISITNIRFLKIT